MTALKPGDKVLIGMPAVTMPADWFVATVLWADRTEMLIEHQPPSGGPYRQVLPISHVRAKGKIAELAATKDHWFKALKRKSDRVRRLESALGRARAAVWAELDKAAEGDT